MEHFIKGKAASLFLNQGKVPDMSKKDDGMHTFGYQNNTPHKMQLYFNISPTMSNQIKILSHCNYLEFLYVGKRKR